MRTKIIAGNWKMNGSSSSIENLLTDIEVAIASINKAQVIVCPPVIYLPQVSQKLSNSSISYGAQDVSDAKSGAFTGEISATMLNDFNCKYAIVGHSERRNAHGESNELVAAKFHTAQKNNINPILCVGELLDQRESGNTEKVVAEQIDAVINLCGIRALKNSIIAYEPVWAIGTGITATPEQAQKVHQFIRERIAEKNPGIADNIIIQYGGSMNASNAEKLLAMDDIDGGLIGGASLKASDFLAIINVAQKLID